MSENNSSVVGGYLAVFAVGALIGAGAALLYAPRSGKDTREMLTQKVAGLKDALRNKKAEVFAAVEAGKEAMREERAKHSHTDA
jgi:gas vesicle protein